MLSLLATYHSMHSIHGYILGITAVGNMLVMYHMEFTATMNTISYTHVNNLTLIYACLLVIHNLRYTLYTYIAYNVMCIANFTY